MAEITLVRTDEAPPTDAHFAVITRAYRGLTEQDHSRWRRWLRALQRMEPGEITEFNHRPERDLPTHRGYMKLEGELFAMQERFEHRSPMRDWMKVGAAFVEWHPGPDGVMVPIPKRLTFEACDDDDFHLYVQGALAYMRSDHFGAYLWPHATPGHREETVDLLLAEYEKFLRRFET